MTASRSTDLFRLGLDRVQKGVREYRIVADVRREGTACMSSHHSGCKASCGVLALDRSAYSRGRHA